MSGFKITVNTSKNRIYIVGDGFPTVAEGKQYLADYTAALKQVKPGFTVLVDARTLEPTRPEVQENIAESMRLSVSLGLSKVARVVTEKVAGVQLQRLAREGKGTQHSAEHFTSMSEAEQYLDQS